MLLWFSQSIALWSAVNGACHAALMCESKALHTNLPEPKCEAACYDVLHSVTSLTLASAQSCLQQPPANRLAVWVSLSQMIAVKLADFLACLWNEKSRNLELINPTRISMLHLQLQIRRHKPMSCNCKLPRTSSIIKFLTPNNIRLFNESSKTPDEPPD